MTPDGSTLLGLATALGAGLVIGIERERRKGSGPQRALAGARTFSLAALAGAIAQVTGEPWLAIAGALLIVLLVTIGYWRGSADDPGMTTELALFVTYVLGTMAIEHPTLAAGTAVIVATLLASRHALHEFSTESLTETELRDALVFAGAALVVLPLLPDRPIAAFLSADPRQLWGLVVLFMAVQAAGYIALRIFGTRLGLALSGFAAGFVSSTATVAALGTRARQDPALLVPCVSGAMFSTVSTFVLMAIVATAVHAPVLPVIGPSIAAGFVTVAIIAALSLRKTQALATQMPKGRAFRLSYAAVFSVGLTVLTAVVAWVRERFGNVGVEVGTALAGFFDVHAAGASAFVLAANHKVEVDEVLIPMLLAVSTNTTSKLMAAFVSGGFAYAWRVGMGLLLTLMAAWAPLLLR